MQRPFSRLAIVNRGEPAMRVIHAVRELNVHRAEPIRVIALYTEPERDAMFVRHADEAVALDGGYLDHEALERALREARADAAWVGWGFVAEQPEFAELCERLGIVFVGPDAAVMRLVGDKIAAKRLAEEAGVPVAPWSGGPVETVDEALRHAERIGFPLMIKSAAGGGGRGIRRVDEPEALPAAFAGAQAEADAGLRGRHRAAREARGAGAPRRGADRRRRPGRRVGGRRARLLVPAPQPEGHRGVGEPRAQRPSRSTRSWRRRGGWRCAPATAMPARSSSSTSRRPRRFSFMEVDARLQVEHPVTEAVTGLDLVKLQLHVAAGGRLEGEPPPPTGHAIEARLNAEDPALGLRSRARAGSRCCACPPARACASTPASPRATSSRPSSTR